MMTRRLLVSMMATALLPGAMFAAWSQVAKPAVQADSPAKTGQDAKKPKVLDVRYATFKNHAATETSDFTSAVIMDVDEGTVVRAEKVTSYGKKGVEKADATGDLQITDKQADVTGEKATIFFAKGKELAVLTGSVVILVKPKSEQKDPTKAVEPMPVVLQSGKAKVEPKNDEDDTSSASARKYPATITCDKLEYEYNKKKKHAVLTGSFKVVQKLSPTRTRTLYADHAEWFGLEDRLLLYGPVRWEDTKDNLKGESPENVTVFTKENDEKIEMKKGHVVFEVHDEEEEGNPPAGKTGDKPPATKPPAAKPEEKPGPDKKANP